MFTLIRLTPTSHYTNINTAHPPHPPHINTHLKGNIKERMMRNKTSYRRLTSIYKHAKEKL